MVNMTLDKLHAEVRDMRSLMDTKFAYIANLEMDNSKLRKQVSVLTEIVSTHDDRFNSATTQFNDSMHIIRALEKDVVHIRNMLAGNDIVFLGFRNKVEEILSNHGRRLDSAMLSEESVAGLRSDVKFMKEEIRSHRARIDMRVHENDALKERMDMLTPNVVGNNTRLSKAEDKIQDLYKLVASKSEGGCADSTEIKHLQKLLGAHISDFSRLGQNMDNRYSDSLNAMKVANSRLDINAEDIKALESKMISLYNNAVRPNGVSEARLNIHAKELQELQQRVIAQAESLAITVDTVQLQSRNLNAFDKTFSDLNDKGIDFKTLDNAISNLARTSDDRYRALSERMGKVEIHKGPSFDSLDKVLDHLKDRVFKIEMDRTLHERCDKVDALVAKLFNEHSNMNEYLLAVEASLNRNIENLETKVHNLDQHGRGTEEEIKAFDKKSDILGALVKVLTDGSVKDCKELERLNTVLASVLGKQVEHTDAIANLKHSTGETDKILGQATSDAHEDRTQLDELASKVELCSTEIGVASNSFKHLSGEVRKVQEEVIAVRAKKQDYSEFMKYSLDLIEVLSKKTGAKDG
jgi:chromosome segregation ATPase